jgi:hypothetical protein
MYPKIMPEFSTTMHPITIILAAATTRTTKVLDYDWVNLVCFWCQNDWTPNYQFCSFLHLLWLTLNFLETIWTIPKHYISEVSGMCTYQFLRNLPVLWTRRSHLQEQNGPGYILFDWENSRSNRVELSACKKRGYNPNRLVFGLATIWLTVSNHPRGQFEQFDKPVWVWCNEMQ